jgi:SAM-dependent methyltransferase
VDDRRAALADLYRVLKPGGVLVTSTACIGDMAWYFKLIAPVGRVLGLIPLVAVFTRDDLAGMLLDAGFEIDREWLPKKNAAVFIVARKPSA